MYAVEMKGISKSFGSVLACDNIKLSIEKSCVHSLVGENGAGKTTLMSILYGIYKPDKGDIFIKGKKMVIKSPLDAIKNGVGMVFQHYSLIPKISVFRNVILGKENEKGLLIKENILRSKLEKIMQEAHIEINLDSKISSLSVGEQQKVEILKLLFREANILIFDEPTASLVPHEVEELFKTILNLKKSGKTIILITHKLNEVMKISDYITVLRKGKSIATKKISDTSLDEIATLMIGKDIDSESIKPSRFRLPLNIEHLPCYINLQGINYKGKNKQISNINFTIHRGEIFGIAGVEGNGQRELINLLLGIEKIAFGKIYLKDQDISNYTTNQRIQLGVKLIPEDRYSEGIIPDFTLEENLLLGNHQNIFCNKGIIDKRKLSDISEVLIDKLSIVPHDSKIKVKYFSGGNQQKVVIARSLIGNITFLIAAQPTRGLDFKSTNFVHQQLIELANKGVSVLLISSNLDELFLLADRIAVMYKGRIVTIENITSVDEEKIGYYMAGILGSEEIEKV